jgi:branched-chain amino acid transport system permease protein
MANLITLVALLVLPFAVGDYWTYQLGLYYLYAMVAVGLGLCWGQAGFLPLGQAMFFGVSAYLSAILLKAMPGSYLIYLLLPLAALASGVLALLIGLMVFRRDGGSGPFFSLITLALSMLAFQIASNWNSVTGGFNGLAGIPALPGIDDFRANYYLAAVALVAVLAIASWLYSAPLGVLWRAITQNERRVALFGFNPDHYKAIAFAVSGFFAGLAGALYAPQQGLVSPQVVGFAFSAELLVWTAVGGRGRLYGPVLGTLLVGSMTAEMRDSIPYWEVIMAGFFMVVVLAFPQGVIGLFTPVTERLRGAFADARPRVAIEAPARTGTGAQEALTIDAARVSAGGINILNDLTVAFPPKGVACIIGPNGAGKTSTFNLITGELPASAGSVKVGALDITNLAPYRVARLGFGRKLQAPSVFPELSIGDNLAIALWSNSAGPFDLLRRSLRRWSSPIIGELAGRYAFLGKEDAPASDLSHGERQILELAMALAVQPRILLLDEPCAGLSADETSRAVDVIRWAAERLGNVIIIIEHDMALVRRIADRVMVFHNGALLAEGCVADIQADPAVQAVYVGGQK